jgi:hypothetical protein
MVLRVVVGDGVFVNGVVVLVVGDDLEVDPAELLRVFPAGYVDLPLTCSPGTNDSEVSLVSTFAPPINPMLLNHFLNIRPPSPRFPLLAYSSTVVCHDHALYIR